MSTLGWILILAGIILARQVVKGRASNIGTDLSDAFLAITRGDSGALSDVFSRTGTDNQPVEGQGQDSSTGTLTYAGKGNPANAATDSTPPSNVIILREAVNLGEAAKGYRLTATGPDYYDCSGLIWRACQKAGFTGVRFTTYTIRASKSFTQLFGAHSGITLGDIVLWPNHHMGVVSGADRFYSARSVKSGIGEAQISTFEPSFGAPIYLRYKG